MWISILLLKECNSILVTTVSSIIYEMLDQILTKSCSWPLVYLMNQASFPLRSSIFFSNDFWNIHMKYVKSSGFSSNCSISTGSTDCSHTNFESISAVLSFSCTDFCCLLLQALLSSFWFSMCSFFSNLWTHFLWVSITELIAGSQLLIICITPIWVVCWLKLYLRV